MSTEKEKVYIRSLIQKTYPKLPLGPKSLSYNLQAARMSFYKVSSFNHNT